MPAPRLVARLLAPPSGLRGLALGGAAALFAGGCTVGPDYVAPATPSPEKWTSELEGGVVAGPADLNRWWSVFKDPALDSLIERAIAGNLDLKEARARVVEARAQRGVAAAADQPQLDGSAGYTRSRSSKNTGFGGSSGGGGFGGTGETRDLYQAGFDANWELDVFGRVRRDVEAADADIDAARESERNVMVTLLAEVARNYVEVRAFQQRMRIADDNIRLQQETVNLSRARFDAGLSNELDLNRALSQLASTKAAVPQLQAGLRQAAYRLGVLLGREPGALLAELMPDAPIPGTPPEVAVGLPVDLLRRRPDIRSAERNVAAATARIGVATADLYPRFSLLGSLSLQSGQLEHFPELNSGAFSIGPSMQWAIFSGGRIRAGIRAADARTEQAIVRYERTVLVALEESEGAIVNYAREQDRRRFLQASVAAEQRAVDLATELYTKGLADFFSVIDTQRQLFALQDQLVQSERSVTANLIAIYKALGGGWEELLPETAPAATENKDYRDPLGVVID